MKGDLKIRKLFWYINSVLIAILLYIIVGFIPGNNTDKKTFASLFYGILDKKRHTLSYANAGQNWPLIFSQNKPPVPISKRGLVLGAISETQYEEEEIAIKSGDLLLIFSDGVVEAMNEESEEFGEKRLQEIVTLYRESPANVVMERILSAIKLFSENGSQHDDITIIAMRRVI